MIKKGRELIIMKRLIKNISVIICIYVLVGIALPFVFKYSIFENNTFSNLNNGEWASFLGSYVGGILGGLGTLIAVFITVKDSKEAQLKNEEDTTKRIENDRKERNRERDEDKVMEEIKEKNRFAISVAEYLGKYVTHISKYYYANLHAESARNDYLFARQNLLDIENKIEGVNNKIDSVDSNSDEFVKLEVEKEHLTDKKQKIQREYEEKRYENRKNSEEGNRTIANECFFTLNTMLYGIPEASTLRNKLGDIHNGSARSDWELFEQKWLSNSIEEIMRIYDEFKKEYTNIE